MVAGSLAGARRLFREAPCLGVWATLAPLADYYGAEGAEVYHHISDGLGVHLNDPANRSIFKSVYKAAAARMGIALAGNNPTQIFFAPLGVADAQIQPLANALIAAMAHLGIPSTEDTPSAVAWQRRALTWCPDTSRLAVTQITPQARASVPPTARTAGQPAQSPIAGKTLQPMRRD